MSEIKGITGSTRVYGLIGSPVSHSLGPLMHNTAFARTGWPGIYAAFEVHDIKKAAAGIRGLNIAGASVTIPHKETVLRHLDQVDEEARQAGAVNTILNDSGTLKGFNTDSYGAVQALLQKIDIEGRNIIVIGAGGAARAVCTGLKKHGASIFISNRSEDRGKRLASELGVPFYPLDQIKKLPREILVNTTPSGMHPNTHETPVPEGFLHKGMTVMDIIYNPLKTRLLMEAEEAGAAVIDGVQMFVLQGARQFELWTGLDAPLELMKKTVYEALEQDINR